MPRLNIERQGKLEPLRLSVAKKEIMSLGCEIIFECDTRIEFMFNDKLVKYYPYSGWATGASIKDGRGLQNLLKQLK